MTPIHQARRAAGAQRFSLMAWAAASDAGEDFRGVGVWGCVPSSSLVDSVLIGQAQGCRLAVFEMPKCVSILPRVPSTHPFACTSCVTLSKLMNLSESQICLLQNEVEGYPLRREF